MVRFVKNAKVETITSQGGMMEVLPSFGEWLRDRRKRVGLTQGELAARVGCSVSAIRKIESGLRRPSRQIAELVARSLEVPDDWRDVFVKVARGERRLDSFFLNAVTLETEREFHESRAKPFASLPIPATPLIGRSPELSQLIRLLRTPECRLITIVGPGGIGKTRFAIEAAQIAQSDFYDGAVFVSLASVSSPRLISSAIGQAFGMIFQGAGRSEDRLIVELKDRELLLILDNMEHLLEGADIVSTILERTKRIKVLVTSHARLNLQGEWSFEISGLPVPPPEQTEGIGDYSSVRLFVESARRSDRDFWLEPQDEKWVSQICQLTEGSPLAIELAASWIRLLNCKEIAHEIAQSLDFLSSESAGLPKRHRSIRAVFDYSWQLLTPDEQVTLSRLSVFQGGFLREAAGHVASARLETLSRLVDHSLLKRTVLRRYEIHDILRGYTLEKLKQNSDDFLDTRTRHSRFYSAWLASLEDDIRGERQIGALRLIAEEIDNIRLAWNWAISHSMYPEIRQAIASMSWFYEMRGWYQEGAETFQQAVDLFCVGRPGGCQSEDEAAETEHTLTHGRLRAQMAHFLMCSGQYRRALEEYEKAHDLLEAIPDNIGLADVNRGIARVHYKTGDFQSAVEACLKSLEIGKRVDYDWNSKVCHTLAGIIHFAAEELDSAQKHLEMSLDCSVTDLRSTALAKAYLGRIAAKREKFNDAVEKLEASWGYGQKCEDPTVVGLIQEFIGTTALEEGRVEEARSWLHRSRVSYTIAHDQKALATVDRLLEAALQPAPANE